MRYKKITYAALFLALTFPIISQTGNARAQQATDKNKVSSEIERTDEVIRRAEEVVRETRSQKGRLRLMKAEEIQSKAHEALSINSYNAALKLTLEARQEANQAIGIARLETQTEQRMGRTVEETVECIMRVRGLIIDYNIKAEAAIKLLEEARNLLEKSRLNAHQHRYNLAMKLAETARQRALQAEQRVRRIRSLKETTERRLELMERLIYRTKERVQEFQNEHARQQIELAERQLEMARELLMEGRYRMAKRTAEKCEKTLRSLARRFPINSMSSPDVILNDAYRLLGRAEELLMEEGERNADPEKRELIRNARDLLDQAKEEISRKHTEEAKRLIIEAQRLLQRAIGKGNHHLTAERVASMIEAVENLHDEILATKESCTAAGIQTLAERAASHLDKARAYLKESRLQAAAAESRIAQNMYNRIREICSN